MPKRIRRVSDLPDWFQLKKYKELAELDASGWYEQLFVRQSCYDTFSLSNDFDSGFKRELPDSFLDALIDIRETPIVDVTSSIIYKVYFLGGSLRDFKTDGLPHYSLGVYSMTPRNLKQGEGLLSKDRCKYLNLWWDQFSHDLSDINIEKLMPHKEWIDAPLHESLDDSFEETSLKTLGLVSVNLKLPDALIIDSFKQWLENARKESKFFQNKNQYRRPDFESWINFGVLPWLDLSIWQKEKGVSIPNRVMADAIFSLGTGGEEVVRKTTKPLAISLISDDQAKGYPLTSLATQAAYEVYVRKTEEFNL